MKYVYVLRSVGRPEKTYIGVTKNPNGRLKDHNEGKCRYTAKFRPWEIVYFEECEFAFQRERQLKKWSRAKKEALMFFSVTDPASFFAPPYSKNFSVKVVLLASGWEMIAKVRWRATSDLIDITNK